MGRWGFQYQPNADAALLQVVHDGKEAQPAHLGAGRSASGEALCLDLVNRRDRQIGQLAIRSLLLVEYLAEERVGLLMA